MATDGELALRAKAGDREAFDELWSRYAQRIHAYALHRTQCLELAADIAQETAIRAWMAFARGQYDERGELSSWLYSIARNQANTHLGRRQRRSTVPDGAIALEDVRSPERPERQDDAILAKWLLAELDRALEDAAPSGTHAPGSATIRRLAFAGYHLDGLSVRELQCELAIHARALGVPEPTMTQLNNWLCRGDILVVLVGHLIEESPELLLHHTMDVLGDLGLSAHEAQAARRRWRDGESVGQIAEGMELMPAEVGRILASVLSALAQKVAARLKEQLHGMRYDL
jgi:RNA polymerase sigma factor (sigma-70 family)